jgi:hypothetical protein
MSKPPLIISAPIRFALISPGETFPELIAASSDGVSDLVGRFSAKELGIQSIVDEREDYLFPKIFLQAVGIASIAPNLTPSMLEIRVKTEGLRDTVLTLVVEEDILKYTTSDEKLSIATIVSEIYYSHDNDDATRAGYFGGALNSVISGLKNRSQKRRSNLRLTLTTILLSALITMISLIASLVISTR